MTWPNLATVLDTCLLRLAGGLLMSGVWRKEEGGVRMFQSCRASIFVAIRAESER